MTDRSDPDAAAREMLRLIGPDPTNWVPDRPNIDHNVVLVGGGQTGCALAWALRRAGIGKVSVIDAAPDEDAAGIWRHTARMHLLRTPKNLVGPEGSLPALGFQAWYEARHDAEAYQALDRIPRLGWAAYLGWYRQFLGIPVRYGVRLLGIEPMDGGLRLHLNDAGTARSETTRKLVLCTGFDGIGGPAIPAEIAGLPAALCAHTEQRIDFAALAGRRVAVIGAAASAFDAAGVALEHGAAAVHLFARRPEIAATAINRSRGYPGAYDNYAALPDAIRWQQALRFRRAGSTPTVDAIERAVRHPNFHLHLAAPWQAARVEDGGIRVTAAGATHRFDFVIAGTGYTPDLAVRPELASLAPYVALWRDRFTPPAEEADAELGGYPYLGEGHEYVERTPGTAPWLADIHVQNPSGFVSFGVPTGDVPSMKRDVPAIVSRISRDLFLADLPAHAARMVRPVAPDFGSALYAAAARDGEAINTTGPVANPAPASGPNPMAGLYARP